MVIVLITLLITIKIGQRNLARLLGILSNISRSGEAEILDKFSSL
jgi:hypothetical protein